MPLPTYTLYTYFRSSAAHRVRIALNLKGISYTPVYVNLATKENYNSFVQEVNPFMRIPILVPNAIKKPKSPIIQSTAIIEFLDEVHPDPPLYPLHDPHMRAQIRGIVNTIACDIHPLYNSSQLEYIKSLMDPIYGKEAENEKMEYVKRGMTHGLSVLEEILHKTSGRFCFGDIISMADIYLIPQIKAAERRGVQILPSFPTLSKIYNNAMGLEAFLEASPERQDDFSP